MNERIIETARAELCKILAKTKDEKLIKMFLKDLFTYAEWQDIPMRWQIIKLLNNGVTQREIAKRLKVSIAKITRGSRMLQNKNGGFSKMLKLYD